MKTLKIVRIICIVITIISVISALQPKVEAKTFNEMRADMVNWLNIGKGGKTGVDSGKLGEVVMPVVNILTAIGVIVLVAVTTIMGFKYMFATPEEAAKLKQQLIGLVVSAVVILGAVAVWKIVYQIVSQLE